MKQGKHEMQGQVFCEFWYQTLVLINTTESSEPFCNAKTGLDNLNLFSCLSFELFVQLTLTVQAIHVVWTAFEGLDMWNFYGTWK